MGKINPKQRLEFFLAKIAGEDVDIATLVPPVPTSQTEKILLEIADRMSQSGGGDGGSSESLEDLEQAIQDLEDAVTALEERIAALEGDE